MHGVKRGRERVSIGTAWQDAFVFFLCSLPKSLIRYLFAFISYAPPVPTAVHAILSAAVSFLGEARAPPAPEAYALRDELEG